jgi:hypothetical protein
MKNKIIYILIGLAAFVIFIAMNIKKEITFSEYAKTKIENRIIDFGVAKLGDTIKKVYAIENISDKSFVISDLQSDKDVFFEGTILDKSNFPGQKKSIYVQFIPETKGIVSRQIEVVSNSTSGIIKLELKGRVE